MLSPKTFQIKYTNCILQTILKFINCQDECSDSLNITVTGSRRLWTETAVPQNTVFLSAL